jgi:hypothetical protein
MSIKLVARESPEMLTVEVSGGMNIDRSPSNSHWIVSVMEVWSGRMKKQ